MKDELKKSLQKVFEHEQLGIQHTGKKRRKLTLVPLLVSAVVIIAVSILTISIVRDSIPGSSTSSSNDKATLDYLHGEHIGDNSAVSEITNTILYDYDIQSLELHTKNEPYGVTLHVNEDVPLVMRFKYAVYLFSLIPNAAYIKYDLTESYATIDKTTLEKTYDIDFSSIKGDEAILTTYYKAIASILPQVQTSRDDAYKYLFNAVHVNQIMSDFDTGEAPTASFKLDDQQYILWLNESDLHIVDIENPTQAILVEGSQFEDVQQFLTADYELVTGSIQEIIDNQLLITAGKDMGYLITVDNGKDYKVGEIVTAWSTRMTMSIPAQAHATKIQRK